MTACTRFVMSTVDSWMPRSPRILALCDVVTTFVSALPLMKSYAPRLSASYVARCLLQGSPQLTSQHIMDVILNSGQEHANLLLVCHTHISHFIQSNSSDSIL